MWFLLIELIEKDFLYTVVSARSVKSIQTIFSRIDLKLPIIEFNGAFISEYVDSRTKNRDSRLEKVKDIRGIDDPHEDDSTTRPFPVL